MTDIRNIKCRAYQAAFGLGMKILPAHEPNVIAGPKSLLQLRSILNKGGASHPLVVTGPRIVKSDFFASAVKLLSDYSVFSDVHPDPDIETVEKIVAIYREDGCDSFVAIGGGSNMDAAKAAAAQIARPDKTLAEMGGTLKVLKKTPLLIAVPTTAGTGSECTVAAVITDEKTGHKYAINDFVLCPDYAILDPELTLSLPPFLTACTGMDALTHAVEAYLNKPYHRIDTASRCEGAVKAIMHFLPIAFEYPDHMQAREELLLASYKAGLAFTTACVGNVHAIAHTIGGLYHVSHGLANAVILPIVLEDYGSAVEKPLAKLARLAKIEAGSDKVCARAFIRRIRQMNTGFGIPDHIDEIQKKDIPQMAEWADAEANPLYPVPVIYDQEHFAKIIRKVGNII